MADALCGPSNALQNFQKHTSVDRTLQQDRLTNRHASSQGFRSSPGPNAGLLDPEFEAFQAGHPAPTIPGYNHFQIDEARHTSNNQIPPQAGTVGWASDFQQLHIHDTPSPQPFAQIPVGQPNRPQGWHQEFLAQPQQAALGKQRADVFNSSYGPLNYGLANHNLLGAGLSHSEYPAQFQYQQSTHDNQPGLVDQQQAEQFDRAFEALEAELREKDQSAMSSTLQEEAVTLDGTTKSTEFQDLMDGSFGEERALEEERYDQEEIQRASQEPENDEDADELARTAGRLLESVKDNQSSKFQSSAFLSLMRRIRDREVRVEGDRMVESTSQSTTIGSDHGLDTGRAVDAGAARPPSSVDQPLAAGALDAEQPRKAD